MSKYDEIKEGLKDVLRTELNRLQAAILAEKKARPHYVFIPDHRFSERVGVENLSEGSLYRSCDAFMERVEEGHLHGYRCPLCGFTFWLDPENGGIYDNSSRSETWAATEVFEDLFNYG